MADRKKHKAKVAQFKMKIEDQRAQYKKFMQLQMDMIQRQIAAKQTTTLNLSPNAGDTGSGLEVEAQPTIELENQVEQIKTNIENVKHYAGK